mmetsp:Transcript_96249/g.170515  ORF Transcript_96249/g.170515 Transcript_96249/m.170515 type:complete len:87 (-) Transcript_96249:881-1141(-)
MRTASSPDSLCARHITLQNESKCLPSSEYSTKPPSQAEFFDFLHHELHAPPFAAHDAALCKPEGCLLCLGFDAFVLDWKTSNTGKT